MINTLATSIRVQSLVASRPTIKAIQPFVAAVILPRRLLAILCLSSATTPSASRPAVVVAQTTRIEIALHQVRDVSSISSSNLIDPLLRQPLQLQQMEHVPTDSFNTIFETIDSWWARFVSRARRRLKASTCHKRTGCRYILLVGTRYARRL